MDVDFSTMPSEGNPFAEQDRARSAGPIFWSDALHGWVVTNYVDVKNVISDPVNFCAENTPLAQAFGAEAMLVIDSPLHHKMRAVWAKPASLSGVAAIADDMDRVAGGLIQPLAPRIEAGEEIELVELFEAYVSEMITKLMDIPSHYKTNLLGWNRVISDLAVLALDESDPRFKQRLEAKEAVYALLHKAIADRRERFALGLTSPVLRPHLIDSV
jgi:cytochrome P450